ncbi:MAG: [FeFe] hydrogenase H-cluster radical SAM maturase HydE [bacterium]
MCYAIPGKITGFEKGKVIVDYFGEKRYARNEFEILKEGDYIYAQGGFVINKIEPKEAEEILEFWKETFFNLREVDLRLSKIDGTSEASKKTRSILDKALEGRKMSPDDFLHLMNLSDEKELDYLFKVANFIRQKYHKNACCVHGIIEFSNYCINDCLYCGIRKSNAEIERYRMSEREILDTVRESVSKYGFKALVLQSGDDPFYDVEKISGIISKIRKNNAVLLFISTGEVGEDGLREFYKAGARGVLIRFETSNSELYSKLHPGDFLKERLAEIEAAKKLGFLVLTGALIGLPEQKNEDILKDIFAAKKISPEMYTFGPFLPHPRTSFSYAEPPSVNLVLKTIALLRIADPLGKIVSTTALETLEPKTARKKGFMAGANSLMLNLTPEKYRRHYQIYPDRIHEKETVDKQIDNALDDLQKLGRAPTDLGVRT